MGASLTRRQAVPQSNGPRSQNPYRYPPADGGNYFTSNFHLGHRKFPAGEPEVYLFGELNDLNFLRSKPIAFPYKQPAKSEPIKCLHSYINLQRDSVKLVKAQGLDDVYHVEFIFDSDTDCRFTVYNFLPDSVELDSLRNGSTANEGIRVSRPYHYSSGSDQQFSETGFTLAPGEMDDDQLTYDPEEGQERFPVAILMETDGTDDAHYQCQLTVCSLDRPSDNGHTIKVLKQKLWADGVEYLLQEIYGIENKSKSREEESGGEDADSDDEEEDLGAECVICITDVKDTILLPCRHLCLCSGCAANLRCQSSNCPICRAPFRALLQITALQPLDPEEVIDEDEMTGNPKYAIPGYRSLPLLQAINGYTSLEGREETGGGRGGRDQEDEDNEDETAEGEERTETSQNQPERMTEFCVIPIDDDDDLNESLTSAPPTVSTLIPRQQRSVVNGGPVYKIDEESVPLPGTPTDDDANLIRIKPSRSSSSSSFRPNENTTVAVPIVNVEGERGGQGGPQSVTTTPLDSHPFPRRQESTCSSSVSSEQSVKSSDMLLPSSL